MSFTIRHKHIFILIFSLVLIPKLVAQDLDKTLALGNYYYQHEEYQKAVYAFQRVAFFSKSDPEPDLYRQIARCFSETGDFELALKHFDHAYFLQKNDSIRKEILFEKTATFLNSRNFQFALIELYSLESPLSLYFEKKQAFYAGVSYFGLEQFEKSEQEFLKCLPETDTKRRDDISDIFKNKKLLQRPNPKAAFFLSLFIPGLGQAYSGDFKSAANSFLLNGFFIYLGVQTAINSGYITAALSVLPWFQRYYQGGFNQAEKLAEKQRAKNRNAAYLEILRIIAPEN